MFIEKKKNVGKKKKSCKIFENQFLYKQTRFMAF